VFARPVAQAPALSRPARRLFLQRESGLEPLGDILLRLRQGLRSRGLGRRIASPAVATSPPILVYLDEDLTCGSLSFFENATLTGLRLCAF